MTQWEKMIAFFKDLCGKNFFGEIRLKFNNGKVILITKIEDIKP